MNPTNQMAHLLADMIEGKTIAEQDYSYNRFRGSISDLINHYGISILHRDVSFVNRFGRKSRYRAHFILTVDRPFAREVFNRINQSQKVA